MGRIALILVIAGTILGAQAPRAPSFDAVSIKPVATPPERSGGGFLPGGRFVMTNATLETLVRMAHNLEPYQLVNAGPSWIASEEFSIEAKAAPTSGAPLMPAQIRPLLQGVLADRFNLKTHRETRELPVYNLLFARRDQRLGPHLRPTRIDCSTDEGRIRALSVMADGHRPCGTIMSNGFFAADGVDFSLLTRILFDRPVINRTGLSGAFDWELKWTPEPDLGFDNPALSTAFQEQLGLKFESGRGAVEVLVIDSAERPTPN